MAEINWTSEAQQWLRDIHDYIAIDNAVAALRTVESICWIQRGSATRELKTSRGVR